MNTFDRKLEEIRRNARQTELDQAAAATLRQVLEDGFTVTTVTREKDAEPVRGAWGTVGYSPASHSTRVELFGSNCHITIKSFGGL